jgi:hypothetical protein
MRLYAEPGTWSITKIYISDFAGYTTYSSGSKLLAVIARRTIDVINNGSPDFIRPTVSFGKLLTPKVSLSSPAPYFEAKLTVADDLSGVDSVLVSLQGPGGFLPVQTLSCQARSSKGPSSSALTCRASPPTPALGT